MSRLFDKKQARYFSKIVGFIEKGNPEVHVGIHYINSLL